LLFRCFCPISLSLAISCGFVCAIPNSLEYFCFGNFVSKT
jgi:hypothetical protein